MKNNKLNIDLSSLYQAPLIRDYGVAGIDIEYDEWKNKYAKERALLENFIAECTLEDFVHLFISAFKEKFPNVMNLIYTFCMDSVKNSETRTTFTSYNRTDVKNVVTEMHRGPIKDELNPGDRDCYETEVTINFKEKIPEKAVKAALEGTKLSQETEDEKTIFKLEDNPIQALELTDKNITIYTNPEKAILYYKL